MRQRLYQRPGSPPQHDPHPAKVDAGARIGTAHDRLHVVADGEEAIDRRLASKHASVGVGGESGRSGEKQQSDAVNVSRSADGSGLGLAAADWRPAEMLDDSLAQLETLIDDLEQRVGLDPEG